MTKMRQTSTPIPKVFVSVLTFLLLCAPMLFAQTKLDPSTITKYKDALPKPAKLTGTYLEIGAYEISQKLHSDLPPTTLWGYGTSQATATFPAATIEATRNVPTRVKWTNNLDGIKHPLPIDKSLHWADPLNEGMDISQHTSNDYDGPVPLTVHLHGAEVEPESDGGPNTWYTPGNGIKGPEYTKEIYMYHNEQPPTTLWYHDHVLGITRLNVYMGLAGFYMLRDPATETSLNLPSGDQEIEIVLQDRMLNTDGSLLFPSEPTNPTVHPKWGPEFFGDIMVVNGVIWPHKEVERRKYRFRFLNGSNARFYKMALDYPGMQFIQIGTDGGYLEHPVAIDTLVIGPGERADVVVDFSDVPDGTNFLLTNVARSPYPDGDPIEPGMDEILQFRVKGAKVSDFDDPNIASTLNVIPELTNPTVRRQLTLVEEEGPGGPLAMFLDGKKWGATISELPILGATEIWEVVNLTVDAHPIHLHLTQFQPHSRQDVDADGYRAEWFTLNPVVPTETVTNPNLAPYLVGPAEEPQENEQGWKDTFVMFPGQVSRIVVRFQPIDTPLGTFIDYPFDATAEPGYVWHCHILDHEDNEMMRPYKVVRPKDFVFVAEDNIKLDGNRESFGHIHSNGDVNFHEGLPGYHSGNVTAVVDATIESNNTINGDVKAGDDLRIFGNASVYGTTSEGGVGPVALPSPSYTAGGADKTATKSHPLTLAPGNYGKIKVAKKATLFLSTGDYNVDELDTDRLATIVCDVSAGPVVVNVVSDLDFDDAIEIQVVGGSTKAVTFNSLQSNKIDIGKYSLIMGNIVAPKAEVHFSYGDAFKGAVFADKVTVDKDVTIHHHDSPVAVPKRVEPIALDDDAIADAPIVTDFELSQNYPNPFNPSTTISFALPEASNVSLKIFNNTGQLVRELVSQEYAAGWHNIKWDAKDDSGKKVASGVYLYRISANSFTSQRKLVLMK